MTPRAPCPKRRSLGTLIASVRAVAAVEFALVSPLLILLYIGGFQLMDVISAYRKVTVTVRTLADLTSQNEKITLAEADAILNGARQVMTPYSTADSTLVFAELSVDKNGTAHMVWTWPSNAGISAEDVHLPPTLAVPNTHVIFSRIIFRYTPVVGGSLIGPITLSDQIFMNPRRSPSVCLNSGTASVPVCVGEGTS